MASDGKRPYVLLADKLPAAWATKLLGRVVADPRYPSDVYAPKRLPQDFFDDPVEVADTNVQITLNANRESNTEAKLYRMLGLQTSHSSDNAANFQSKRVVTRSLDLHPEKWEKLYAKYREEVDKLLATKDCKGKAYMVVAIRTFLDADIEARRGTNSAVVVESEAPVAEALNAAAVASGAPPLLPEEANPKVKVEKKLSAAWLQKNVAEGEQVFAVRCRVVQSRRKWVPWSEDKPADFGQMHRGAAAHGIFGPGGDDDADEVEIELEGTEIAGNDAAVAELLEEETLLPQHISATLME